MEAGAPERSGALFLSRLGGAGWAVVALLLLAVPLVQGGTPRLPSLAVTLAIAALLLAWGRRWLREPRQALRLSLFDALLGAFVFWSLCSILFAPYYHAAEQAVLAIAGFAALYWHLSFNPSFSGLAAVTAAVRAQAVFQALLVFWQRWIQDTPRPPGTFYNPNFLAGFLAVAVLFALGGLLFPPGRPPRSRRASALLIAEAALGAAALLLTGSRGGLLSLAAGGAVLFALRSWRIALATGAAAALLLVAVPNPWFERLRTLDQGDAFAWTRLAIWRSAWAMMLDHPLTGIGLGQFEHVSTRYAFPVPTHWARYTRVAENAHSEYLQAGAELGVPGLLMALAALAAVALAARRRLRELPRREWGGVAPPLAAVAAIAAHAAVDFPLHTPPALLLLAVALAGLRMHGAAGIARGIEFEFRPLSRALFVGLAVVMAAIAIRPVAGFWFFLRGIGAPPDLLHEKRALAAAGSVPIAPDESIRLLERAAAVDFVCAPYHRALGSRLFQAWLRGEGGEGDRLQGLYHLNLAVQLNPNNFGYQINLGQAAVALARRAPPGRTRLAEALSHFEHAAELAPFQYPLYGEIGRISDELGEPAAAEAAFLRAVRIEEYYLRGWLNLGAFYARHGRIAEAREAFRGGAERAERARAFTPTTDAERDLVAVEPAAFYNELKKLDMLSPEEPAS